MSITNWIIKLQKSKFTRRFQYEPYIIKSVEYVDPKPDERIFVVYREVDYFKSLYVLLTGKEDNYFSWDVEKELSLNENVKFDKIVFFVSTYYTTKDKIHRVLTYSHANTLIYCICFLSGSKFFETTLKITDKLAYSNLGKEMDLFSEFEILDVKEFKNAHIKAVKMRSKR